jgi:hypothetical protein
MKRVKLLFTSLTKWMKLTTYQLDAGEKVSSQNYEKEKGTKMPEDYNYSTDQIAGIYAKLETAKLLMKLGTDMAKQVETDIKFYRMTNPDLNAEEDN